MQSYDPAKQNRRASAAAVLGSSQVLTPAPEPIEVISAEANGDVPDGPQESFTSLLESSPTPVAAPPASVSIGLMIHRDLIPESAVSDVSETTLPAVNIVPETPAVTNQQPFGNSASSWQRSDAPVERPIADEQVSSLPRSIPRAPTADNITPQLWNTFVTHCVVEICPSMMNQVNPFLVHLATRARDEPSLFAAVLYLSQTIITKCTSRPLGKTLSAPDMKAHVEALGTALETQALSALDPPNAVESTSNDKSSSLLTQLCTMVTLCTAYITRGDTDKLLFQLESALLLAQSMFKKHLKNDTFRWLLKWLGYIHTISMLSDGSYSLKGPDYFGIATGFKDRDSEADLNFEMDLAALSNNVVYDDPLLFHDVDKFLGISREVSMILYKLGRLSRMKKAAAGGSESTWFWQDYEAEVDDLDLRIEQQIQSFDSAKMMSLGITNLDHYNYSLVMSAKVILLTAVKDTDAHVREVVDAVDELLEACAAVPVESTVAKFMVLPLFSAGMQSTRRLHQDFVRSRLVALRNYYFVSNLPEVIGRLESTWAMASSFNATSEYKTRQRSMILTSLVVSKEACILPLF